MLRVEVLSEELVECSVNSESYIGTITEASRLHSGNFRSL